MALGRKTGGRKKGTPNKTSTKSADVCRKICEDPAYRRNILKRAREGVLGSFEAHLWDRAYGKVRDRIDLEATHHHEIDLSGLSDDELATFRALVAKAAKP